MGNTTEAAVPGFDVPSAYELLQCEDIADIRARGTLLRHKKSGARVALLECDDDNKVFNIAFRTPPKNSTGVAHILEHTVLCGSEHFPLKDPFVELVKGSLNTFLNAMTYPDKTMYPVASCNDQDFQNLMHVYLDAVFYPNIYKEEKIFRQEGWHYELEGLDEPLKINGVVYNEMKGAFSSADEMIEREIFNTLFPDTPYGVESGGDPKVIPELTYEEFLEFHRTYYHPSNSYIYLYGNMDMEEKLKWMDEEYLCHFEMTKVQSEIVMQRTFASPVEKELYYPVLDEDPLENNAYLSCSMVVGDSSDVELDLAMQILDYVLLSAPGAPLKQRLLDEGIGSDVSSSYEDGIRQPFFSIMVKGADEHKKDRFLALIREELERIADEGISHKALISGINYFEFRFREADFSSYPKGLILGIDMFAGWLYDDAAPFTYLKQLHIFEDLKAKTREGYFEDLIRRYFLENTHMAVVTGIPKRGLEASESKALTEKLAAHKAELSEAELKKIIEETKALKAYQDEEESPEALACIPLLKRSDIRRETYTLKNTVNKVSGTTIVHHDIFTNKIAYIQLLFSLDNVPDDLIPYLGLLKSVLGYVGTKHYSYGELFHEINAYSGGIQCGIQVFEDVQEKKGKKMFGIRAKGLYSQKKFLFRMIREILLTSDFTDTKRLKEIIDEQKSRLQESLVSSGNGTAALRANAGYSAMAAFQDRIAGVSYARFIKHLNEHFAEEKEQLTKKLYELMKMVFRPENIIVGITSDEEGYQGIEDEVCRLKEDLYTDVVRKGHQIWQPHTVKEGLITAGQVQFVAKSGNFCKAGYTYNGAFRILKVLMGYEYLWMNIRVKGGAYGCMNGYRRNGDTYMVTYRDPNLKSSLQVFDNAADFIEQFDADERLMDKYVIGAVSEMDVPMTPNTLGSVSMTAYLSGITQEMLQKERDEVLSATSEDIRRLAPLVREVMSQDNICVVGSETAIRNAEDVFSKVENLL